MTQQPAPSTLNYGADAAARRAAMALIAAVTVVRLGVLMLTPLELYPDEAQYWLWSRHLAFGYFSKPPMIAWLIALTTHFGGDAEPYVRAGGVFLNAGTAVTLFFLGRRLYTAWTGALAAALFILMPGVALSSLVISTDTPLLFFSSLALLAYAGLPSTEGGGKIARAAAFGLALGLAMLSKYAVIYLVIGVALHLVTSREARAAWTWQAALATVAVFLLVLAPNLAWNAAHHFQTVAHTASNANWQGRLFNLGELGEFLVSQLGVFGPIPFGVLLVGTVLMVRARALTPADRLLLCVAAPALAVVTVQAFLSRANANWAALTYVPAALLVAAWLLRWKARGWIIAALAIQGIIALVFVAGAGWPRLADQMGQANALKRVRGWDQAAEAIVTRAQTEQELTGLSAVTVDDRLAFFSIRYYGRDYFDRPDAAPLRKWSSAGMGPTNQAEADYGLTTADGKRVLAVGIKDDRPGQDSSVNEKYDAMLRDFAVTSDPQIVRIRLDAKHVRRLGMFVGEGFRLPKGAPIVIAVPVPGAGAGPKK